MKNLIKPLGFLAILILFCAVASRLLNSGETLEEYAKNHPEKAYASPAVSSPTPSALSEFTDVNSNQNLDSNSGTNSTENADASTGSASNENADLNAGSAYNENADVNAGSAYNENADLSTGTASNENADLSTGSASNESADLSTSTASVTAKGTPAPEDPLSHFYYEPLSDAIITRITGISYPVSESHAKELSFSAINIADSEADILISYEDLRYLSVLYYDFNGEVQCGELVCNQGIAQDLLEIFYELYLNEYQIEKIRLIDEYGGDDTASMTDNNTSCFNYRVVDGTDHLSKHALGCAIDINPFYNPYVVFHKDGSDETYISPEGSEIYADRSRDFSYKIDENDLCYKLFKEHGFTWGGDWNSCKDYQHFQKIID